MTRVRAERAPPCDQSTFGCLTFPRGLCGLVVTPFLSFSITVCTPIQLLFGNLIFYCVFIAILYHHCISRDSHCFRYSSKVAYLPSLISLAMNRLRAARWRGPVRQPRHIASLDSLLMIDQVDSIASDQIETLEMHENTVSTRSSIGQDSNECHAATQPPGQGHELLPRRGSQSGSFSSQPLSGTRKNGFGLLREWASEIAALVSAFCCLAAIFIILVKFNDQQQPDWPYARTLNLSTLIALAATILRSMLEVVLSSGK